MKKAVYIGRFEFPDSNAAALRARLITKILKGENYEVSYITTYRSFKEKNIYVDNNLVYAPNTYNRVSYNSRNYLEILSEIGDFDIIIAYNLPSLLLYTLLKYAKKRDIKIIADVTEWYTSSNYRMVKKIIKSFDTFYRMRILHKKMSGLILISKSLGTYYKDKHKIIIPPLVDLDEEKWAIPLSTTKRSEKLKFVYTGNPGKNKDKINYIIDVFERFDKEYDFSFDIYGITKNQYLSIYPEHVNYLNNTKQVCFFGKVDHHSALRAISEADYFVFLRDSNRLSNSGFPTKFVESISLGVPVITNKTSDISDYLVSGHNGFLIEDNNSKDIYCVIEDILKDKIILSKNNSYKKKFHYDNFKDKFSIFINQLG